MKSNDSIPPFFSSHLVPSSEHRDKLQNIGPQPGDRVVVAMSGGVDSSVAALLLKQMGCEVIGVSLMLHDEGEKRRAQNNQNAFGTCCSLSDINDARMVSEKLSFPFYVANMEDEFNEGVIDNFVEEYLRGRTPNPCVKCNEKVKFHTLMDWAMDLGAKFLATGHYASISQNPITQKKELHRALDRKKDQSYFLFMLKENDLATTCFPIGSLYKHEVRKLAESHGLLRVASKPDSQEICFVTKDSYKAFIKERVPPSLYQKGPIVDIEGHILDEHDGLYHFTIGQRKGLGAGIIGKTMPRNNPEPLYVLHLDPASNTVIVGKEEHLYAKEAILTNMQWVSESNIKNPIEATAQIRHQSLDKEVRIETIPLATTSDISSINPKKVKITFSAPARAITPGQACVIYQGTKVIGGGWIEEVIRSFSFPQHITNPSQNFSLLKGERELENRI